MDAFQAGAGFGGDALTLVIAGLGCTAVLLLGAWILISVYRGFARGRVDGDLFAIVSWRALLLIVLCFWLFL
ncbi:MAG TPA: TIGR03758 family integrating conjugative element protein [Modicisalibacter sp.]|nr:TIGR03758 family integrating conjugative element protein [Modicisalibacter sp.]